MRLRTTFTAATAAALLVGLPASVLGAPPADPRGELDDIGALPLGWYLVTQSEVNGILYEAESRLIRTCMEDAGFEYDYPPHIPNVDFLGQRYGVPPDVAAQIGYDSLDALQGGVEQEEPFEGEDDPAFDLALWGEPHPVESSTGELYDVGSGCLAEGIAELYGGLQGYADFAAVDYDIQQLDLDAFARAESSDEVQAALGVWLDCMHAAGYDVASREELFRIQWEEPGPSDEEVATAVAESECLVAADYRSIHIEQETEIQEAMLDERGLDLQEFQDEQAELVSRANEVIAANP